MKRVYLAQVNNSYGNNAFLPYSVGLLWAHAVADDRIRSSYELGGFVFLREDLVKVVDGMRDPSVLALSCYIWNWAYNMELARLVKARWPDCTIVIGGPEAPNASDGFFIGHRNIDAIVHGEGEATFKELLLAKLYGHDLSTVRGISYPDEVRETVKTDGRKRIDDIDTIPSPYLTGLFDAIINCNPDISFHASQETNRGCPYSCTFCDWGSAVMSKVRQFGDDRLLSEIDWFGSRGIDLLYNCDANYGILKRDIDLTRYMAAAKHKYGGYPNKFRAAYAKKSDDKVFEIATMLNKAGMNKGITLSMQSMDPHALELVKRSNIKVDDFKGLMDRYGKAGIPTYTEVIVGLPGETLDSFKDGIGSIMEAGQHDNISIYMCMLLRNSEMADRNYMAKHGIVTKRVPMLSLHGSVKRDGITEMNDIVVGTDSMPYDDWKEANVFAVIVQALHCLGLTHVIAQDSHSKGISYRRFYDGLISGSRSNGSMLGEQIAWVEGELSRVFEKGMDWDSGLDGYGDVSWPLEERVFLSLQAGIETFYDQMPGLDAELRGRQRASVLTQHDGGPRLLDQGDSLLRFSSPAYHSDDASVYAREIVWYGRKASRTKMVVERMLKR